MDSYDADGRVVKKQRSDMNYLRPGSDQPGNVCLARIVNVKYPVRFIAFRGRARVI